MKSLTNFLVTVALFCAPVLAQTCYYFPACSKTGGGVTYTYTSRGGDCESSGCICYVTVCTGGGSEVCSLGYDAYSDFCFGYWPCSCEH